MTPRFTSRDTFEITGRGTVYVCDLPDDLWSAPHSPKLVGKHVWIDDALFKVQGVETPLVHWRPSSSIFRTVGLLARKVLDMSPERLAELRDEFDGNDQSESIENGTVIA